MDGGLDGHHGYEPKSCGAAAWEVLAARTLRAGGSQTSTGRRREIEGEGNLYRKLGVSVSEESLATLKSVHLHINLVRA